MKFRLFGRVIEIRNAGELPAVRDDAAWRSFLTGGGERVGGVTALKVAAVFRCVDLLSKTMASLPLHMMVNTPEGKDKARGHRLYNMVRVLPNEYTTAYEFWQCFVANLLLTPGGYARIRRDRAGYITSLWNIPTHNVTYTGTNPVNGERYIEVSTDEGEREILRPGDYLHVQGFRFSDDEDPEDPLRIAADVLGVTRDLGRYASAAFRQGVNPGGFLEVPAGLSDKAYSRLKEDFEKNYAGVQNQGKYIILEEGTKASAFTRDMEKTQALESRKFAISEVCRLFGVPPHLCMDLERATFSNIEQQNGEYVCYAVNPLSVRIEQAMYRDLLTTAERRRYFFKFGTNALMRGDTTARTAFYHNMRQDGIMNADEIRELEDMNNIPGGAGKIYGINGNMIALENVPKNIPRGAQGGAAATETKGKART